MVQSVLSVSFQVTCPLPSEAHSTQAVFLEPVWPTKEAALLDPIAAVLVRQFAFNTTKIKCCL